MPLGDEPCLIRRSFKRQKLKSAFSSSLTPRPPSSSPSSSSLSSPSSPISSENDPEGENKPKGERTLRLDFRRRSELSVLDNGDGKRETPLHAYSLSYRTQTIASEKIDNRAISTDDEFDAATHPLSTLNPGAASNIPEERAFLSDASLKASERQPEGLLEGDADWMSKSSGSQVDQIAFIDRRANSYWLSQRQATSFSSSSSSSAIVIVSVTRNGDSISVQTDVDYVNGDGTTSAPYATSCDLQIRINRPVFSSHCDYSSKFITNSKNTTLYSKSRHQEQPGTSTINSICNSIVEPSSPFQPWLSPSSTSVASFSVRFIRQFDVFFRPYLSYRVLAARSLYPSRREYCVILLDAVSGTEFATILSAVDGSSYRALPSSPSSLLSLNDPETKEVPAAIHLSFTRLSSFDNPFPRSSLPVSSTANHASLESSIYHLFAVTAAWSLYLFSGGPSMLVSLLRDLLTLAAIRFLPKSTATTTTEETETATVSPAMKSTETSERFSGSCLGSGRRTKRDRSTERLGGVGKLVSQIGDFGGGEIERCKKIDNHRRPTTSSQSFIRDSFSSRLRRRSGRSAPNSLSPLRWVFAYVAFATVSLAACGEDLSKKSNEAATQATISRPGQKTFSNQVAIELSPGAKRADAEALAHRHRLRLVGEVIPESNIFLFQSRRLSKRSTKPIQKRYLKKLKHEPKVLWFEQQQIKIRRKRDVYFNDEKWNDQWYLNRGGGLDMSVEGAWRRNITGKGVVVSILDDGIEKDHPDLQLNYDARASYDVNAQDFDPTPRYDFTNENRHGTRCAGEVAAVANNTVCVVGVAYQASIGGVRMLDGDVTDAVEAQSLSLNPQHIDIYSASWGPDDDGRTVDGPAKMAEQAFQNGVLKGRHGKGSIFVWASGNGGRDKDSCNCDGYTNSIYTLSISSATEAGNIPWYSEACSSTLASTYSSGSTKEKQIITTDLNKGCTDSHTGTSASAPLAAGICALALQANPQLTWRDMQHIVILSARPENLNTGDWVTNGVNRKVSHWFGYGLMDAAAMAELASNWTLVPAQHVCKITATDRNRNIPAKGKMIFNLEVDGCRGAQKMRGEHVKYLEHVQARITLMSTRRGDLEIFLISPLGTRSCLLAKRPRDLSRDGFVDWPFMSTHTWGEISYGTWKLEIRNFGEASTNPVGELKKWSLVLYGTEEAPYQMPPPHPDGPSNGANSLTTPFAVSLGLPGILAILSGFMDRFSTSSKSIPSSPSQSSFSFLRHRETLVTDLYHRGVKKLFTRIIKITGERDNVGFDGIDPESGITDNCGLRPYNDDDETRWSTSRSLPYVTTIDSHQILSDDHNQPRFFVRGSGERARRCADVEIPELPRFSSLFLQLSLRMNCLCTLLSVDHLLLKSLSLLFLHRFLAL